MQPALIFASWLLFVGCSLLSLRGGTPAIVKASASRGARGGPVGRRTPAGRTGWPSRRRTSPRRPGGSRPGILPRPAMTDSDCRSRVLRQLSQLPLGSDRGVAPTPGTASRTRRDFSSRMDSVSRGMASSLAIVWCSCGRKNASCSCVVWMQCSMLEATQPLNQGCWVPRRPVAV